ncbi:MAG: sucrose phosphorylase [Actinomycetota bacterium]|jgi:sucrose phosphorylase|nr:sucrose phosphorylase [Actinomycetota bacterium]MDA3014309.1 sucrose phosphorylase [Actinomycetota bacterium]MDA3027607.1 sucrose phosphorylase [Actinomycetota bacterium]
MRNAPQLITYGDRFAGDLLGVLQMLDGPLSGAFGGVHILPFFVPIDGADAGFDPIDHTAVDPRVGSWDDVAEIAGRYEVMADIIVNHVSDESAEFRDWQLLGEASAYASMFLTLSSVFPDGAAEADLARIYRPRPGMPFTKVAMASGETRLAWTTFTSKQIDIDVESEPGRAHLLAIVDRLATAGVRLIRLDAVGYAIKRAGTSCFMIPETFEFIDEFAALCRERDMTVLVEIHGYHGSQIEIARRVDMVYDFALPPLVLDAIGQRNASALRHWLDIRPTNCVTVLDTHDGIGIVDVGVDPDDPSRPGLLSAERMAALIEMIHRNSGGTSRLATGAAASNLDVYQVNCTFFDALGRNDNDYLLARLIQMLVPGVPQIYYVGLLAGSNDVELLESTGVGRDINRHHFGPRELIAELERPVVRNLLGMLRWRTDHPAFDGTCDVADPQTDREHVLALTRRSLDGSHSVAASIDLDSRTFEIIEQSPSGTRRLTSFNDLGPA